ncbi:MAG TPA: hypothetical protein VKB55_14945 [Nocardioidaceae bacterium]|nr:hypothetical protein [Nocardioidaceae bacterium]
MTLRKPDEPLREGERGNPIVWWQPRLLPVIPDVSDAAMEPAFGGGRNRKLKSWGHVGEHGVHWLVTRSGTPFHADPAYPRYTHHLIVRNDGFRLRGVEDPDLPPFTPGMLYCLDAHSPHQVIVDDRILSIEEMDRHGIKPLYKVQAAVDFDTVIDAELAWSLLVPLLDTEPGATAHQVAKTAPASQARKSGQAPAPCPSPAEMSSAWGLE